METTDSGKETSRSGFCTSATVRSWLTIISLDDIAEHPVGIGISLRHFVPTAFETQRTRLFLEVGELTTRHFVQIDFRRRPLEIAFESRILIAHGLPIEGNAANPFGIEARIAFRPGKRFHDRTKARLRRIAGEGVHRRIDSVDTRIHGGKNRRCRNS